MFVKQLALLYDIEISRRLQSFLHTVYSSCVTGRDAKRDEKGATDKASSQSGHAQPPWMAVAIPHPISISISVASLRKPTDWHTVHTYQTVCVDSRAQAEAPPAYRLVLSTRA